ncbi:MAG: peptide ABC transporter substrate-binding protein [Clostridia bacterium]|nr:peptide ABC transporter substrate-binding protein [Clostridia bacterium]
MKKIIAMVLCFVMLGTMLVACANKEDPGAEITVYMDKVTNLDPAMAYNDADAEQILSLVYDGLVDVNEKGKVVGSIAKSWSLDGNVLEFRLNNTKWSDGTAIQAKDFVYAWKRILNPEFQCSAASLLMYVKNAEAVKNGDTSIDNLGLYASGTNLLTVELIDASYADAFLQNCASVALSPLREDKVEKIKIEPDLLYKESMENLEDYVRPADYSWATLSAVMLANGPFFVKEFNYKDAENPGIILERNKYFYYDAEKEEALQKYVTPYRINIKFADPATALSQYKAGEGLFINNLPLAERKSDAETKDLLSTYSYLFNTNNELFSNAKVTKALSMALDREAIAKKVVFGKAATGLLTDTVWNNKRGTSFREVAGSVLNTKADIAGAKALLAEAGVNGGEFTITIHKDNEVEKAVAEAAIEAWTQLGFKVTLDEVGVSYYKYFEFKSVTKDAEGVATGYEFDYVYSDLIKDAFIEKYRTGDYDVLGIDLSMMTADPFAALAQFARPYSGGAYDFTESADDFELVPGVTGYANEEYDKLMQQALNEKDATKRATILAKAEKLLLEDAPVAPVYFVKSGVLISENLKKLTVNYAGQYCFTKAKDATYTYDPNAVALIPAKQWM